MTTIELLYDETKIIADIPYKNVDILVPVEQNPLQNAHEIINKSFSTPLFGSNSKEKPVSFKGKSIAIAINDQTRPLPHEVLLPGLLHYLNENGADKENVYFVIATGTHRKLTSAEIQQVLPGTLSTDYCYSCHECDDEKELVYLGETSLHTPVYVNRKFYQADVKILVGNIEPHHFMGFSGGYKTASIGLGGRKTIEANHAMLPDPNAKLGHFYDNPMRKDVEDIGRMMEVDFALNIVMNDRKEILHALWGDPHSVMEKGISLALAGSRIEKNEADCRYDLVIASAGGYPKDINLYQAQKAITNACLFSKKGGVIILVAGCRNGAGNEKFVSYVRNKPSWQAVLEDFPSQKFEIGPHKAYQLALQVRDHYIILVSEIPAEEVHNYFLSPAADIKKAVELATAYLKYDCRVAVLPFATHSIPDMEGPK
jgi:nickel-dependent lactate racemase